jgi:queuine tRNA-ribosyltransferase
MTLDCEVVLTRSGEPAMRDRTTGEVMHPVIGPRIESHQLYVLPSRLRERLLESDDDPLVLLDVGLGAGSNAVAALELALSAPRAHRPLRIVSFDRSVAALEQALKPEFAGAFGFTGRLEHAARTLLASGHYVGEQVSWKLALGSLPETLAEVAPRGADIVYWDPFSPAKNPDLWTVAAFTELHARCREGATFFTYSAATATRSALLLAGFAVGEGEATGAGKRTTQAALSHHDLSRPLDARWLLRLSRSTAPLPSDAPAGAFERIREMPQFDASHVTAPPQLGQNRAL